MGKSALTINIATFVAGTGKVVAIFSLEMAKEEVVQRILSSVGKVESSKLRTGQLGNQWDRLVAAANRMYKTPIYVDDSSVVTVTDIRAKCRRLKRVKGLDLVVVDYLQLMQGSSREKPPTRDLPRSAAGSRTWRVSLRSRSSRCRSSTAQ